MSVLNRAPPERAAKRPRKRSYKAAEVRREQILDCALAAFSERGYHGTSIADVCARAGIGRATLYQYFADKRELLVALAERIAKRILDAHAKGKLVQVPSGARPSEPQLIRFVEKRFAAILRVVFEDAATARLVLRAGRGADGVVDEILRRIDAAVLETLESELRAAKQAGVIRDLDEHFVARFFLGGFEKIVLTHLDDDRPLEIEKIAEQAARLEVSGIYPRTQ